MELDDATVEAMFLNEHEALALAYQLVATRVCEQWLEWEDLPNLGEFAFRRLSEVVARIGQDLDGQSRNYASAAGIDPDDLLERAT